MSVQGSGTLSEAGLVLVRHLSGGVLARSTYERDVSNASRRRPSTGHKAPNGTELSTRDEHNQRRAESSKERGREASPTIAVSGSHGFYHLISMLILTFQQDQRLIHGLEQEHPDHPFFCPVLGQESSPRTRYDR